MINTARFDELIDNKLREVLPELIRQEVERELARLYVAEMAKEKPSGFRGRILKKG